MRWGGGGGMTWVNINQLNNSERILFLSSELFVVNRNKYRYCIGLPVIEVNHTFNDQNWITHQSCVWTSCIGADCSGTSSSLFIWFCCCRHHLLVCCLCVHVLLFYFLSVKVLQVVVWFSKCLSELSYACVCLCQFEKNVEHFKIYNYWLEPDLISSVLIYKSHDAPSIVHFVVTTCF